MLVKYNDPERQRNNFGQVALIGVAITLRLPEDPKGMPERAAETPAVSRSFRVHPGSAFISTASCPVLCGLENTNFHVS